jgi:hypothetical protein
LKEIEKVSYLPFPDFKNKQPRIETSAITKFAHPMNVYAGPRVNATIYFKDGLVIKYPTLSTLVSGPKGALPQALDQSLLLVKC